MGHLTVAASLTVAEHLLPAWLGELRRSAPELHVGLQVTNSSRVCDLVRDAVVDLGFIESPGSLRGLRSHAVADDRLVLVVAPDHPWGAASSRGPDRAGAYTPHQPRAGLGNPGLG